MFNFEKSYKTNPHNDEKKGLPRNDTFPVREKTEISLEEQDNQNTIDPEKKIIPINEVPDYENQLIEDFENEKIGLGIASEKKSNPTLEDLYGKEIDEKNQELEPRKEVLINGQKIEDLGEEYQPIKEKDLNIDFNTAPTGKKELLNLNKNEKIDIGIRPEKSKNIKSHRTKDFYGWSKNAKTNNNFKPWQKDNRQSIDDRLGQTG